MTSVTDALNMQHDRRPAGDRDVVPAGGDARDAVQRGREKELQFLYDEWAHPYFISIEEYERLMQVLIAKVAATFYWHVKNP